ncbi:tetratricopeptide repeat protein [Candidatus Ozemobacteraceae bacterium]|nr:tetratricopeptide repeat protein [Candidatus Ozemobacteraceae bacterium]MBP7633093.1 tetratricopeptide repeat protein [Candidatus Ozemobacteraceae bacterium]
MRAFTCLLVALVLCLAGSIPAVAADPADALKECRALERAGKFEEALEKYLELLKASPTEELYRDTGSLLGKLQRYDEAEKLLKDATQAFPRSTPLLNLQALIALRKGRTEDARALWKTVLEIDAGNSFARKELDKLGQAGTASVPEAPAPALSSAPAPVDAAAVTDKPAQGKNETSLSPEEQKKLALSLYEEMIALDKWETARFEALHRQVIEKCPATDHAIESCWRLSNLYLTSEDKPRYDELIEVLEHLVTKYPDSKIVPDAKNRLLIAYKDSGRHEKVVTMYQELFKLNPSPDERTFMIWALDYANALSAVGKTDEARVLYEQVVEKDGGKDQLEARVARERLGQK